MKPVITDGLNSISVTKTAIIVRTPPHFNTYPIISSNIFVNYDYTSGYEIIYCLTINGFKFMKSTNREDLLNKFNLLTSQIEKVLNESTVLD